MRRTALLTGCLALLAPTTAVATQDWARAGDAAPCRTSWVSAWGMAPSDSGPIDQPLVEQTIRQIAVPTIGGNRLRVRFTNRLSGEPVTFGAASIAIQTKGAAVASDTVRRLTFAGSRDVTIPGGAEVVSDPVRLSVRPLQHLAVSVYVRGAAPRPTQHITGQQTSYQTAPGAGDATVDTTGAAFTVTKPLPGRGEPSSIQFLRGLDVRTDRGRGVVAFGDSLTDGTQAGLVPLVSSPEPIDAFGRWPDHLARRLVARGTPLGIVNSGIAGNQLLASNPAASFFGPAGLSRVGPDILDHSGVRDVIVLIGINDLGQGRASAETLVRGYRVLLSQLKARGLRVHLGTLTPQGNAVRPGYGQNIEPVRQEVNAWIRRQRLSDSVIDFDAAVRDPADPSVIDPRYDGGDGLHFNNAGYRAMAGAVRLRALRPGTC